MWQLRPYAAGSPSDPLVTAYVSDDRHRAGDRRLGHEPPGYRRQCDNGRDTRRVVRAICLRTALAEVLLRDAAAEATAR
jgi:hypothetical protein